MPSIFRSVDESEGPVLTLITLQLGGAVAQLGARLDGIEEVVGSNPIGSTNILLYSPERSFTERSEDILYTLGPNGFSGGTSTQVSGSKYPKS